MLKSNKVSIVIVILSVAIIATSVTYSIYADSKPLFNQSEWSFGDPVIARGVNRSDDAKGTYEKAYAYTSVGEIIGTAADWYSYAEVTCEPSDPHYQSDYFLRVVVLKNIVWGFLIDHYSREKSASSVEGVIDEYEWLYMLLVPLPDNMERVSIWQCEAEAKINGHEAIIPEWDIW